ncbi:uncharacterized protein LOC112558028 isoform X2 [Pomacea canaliculata]|uniref:uncharacterized protein LOC112558028 isoform X2 n=1 Tax=Pomacea canaliculata TaxID=400727 RepID=UPI000D73F628|nr:uncharacterized protein LOC112558028 isoform X2 [Pomacea canaliculata]
MIQARQRDLTNLTKPETLTADSRQGTSSTGEWEKSHNMDSRQKKKRTKRTLPHAGQKVALTTSMEESDSDKTCKGNDRRTAGICSRLQNRKYRSLQSSNSQSSASSPGQSRSNTQFDAQNFVQRVKERLQSVRSLATSRQASHLSPSGQNLPLQTSHEAFRSVDSSLLGSVPSKSNVPSNVKSIMCSPNQPPSTDRATKSPVRFNNWNNSSSRKVRASSFGAQSALQQFTEDPICNITNLWHVGESERGNGLQNMDSAYASFRMEHEIGAKYRCWSTWSCGDLADDKKGAKKLKASSCPEDDISFPDLSSCGLPHQNDMLRLKPNRTWPSQLYRCISSSSSSSSSSVSTLFSQVDLEQSSDSESQGYNMCNYMNDRPFDGEDCCSDESETLAASLKVLLAGSTADVMETEKNDVAENRIRLPVTDTGLQSERESGLSTLYRELYHGEVEIDSDEEWKFLATVVNIDFDDADWGASTVKDRSKSGQFQWNTEQSNSSGASSDDQERDMLGSGITGRSAFIVHRQLTEPDKKWSSKELPGSLQPKSEHHSPGGNDLEDGWFDSPGKTSSRKEPTSEQWHSTKYQMPRQADMPCDTQSSSYLVQEENSRTFLPFRQSEQDVAGHSNWLSMTCPSLTGTETVWPGTSLISTSVRQKARRGNNKSELCSDEEEEDNVANGNSTDENYEGDTELDCDCGGCDVTLHGDWMQVTRLSLDENNSVSSSSGIPVQSSLRGAEGILSEEHNAASSSSIPMLPNLPRNQSWTDFPRQLTDDGNIGGASGRQRRSRGRDFQRQSSEDESLMRNSERQSMREVHPGLVLTGNVLEDVDLLGTFLSSHWEELSYHMSIVDRFIEAFAACLSDAPRLTEEELERLTSFPASAIEEGETCAICLSNIQFQEMVIRLPTCSHLFHTTCITKWLSTSRSCPVCRTVVQVQSTLSSSELNLEQNLKDFSK